MNQIPMFPVRLWDFDPGRWVELAPVLEGLVSKRFGRIEALGVAVPPERIAAVVAAGGVFR